MVTYKINCIPSKKLPNSRSTTAVFTGCSIQALILDTQPSDIGYLAVVEGMVLVIWLGSRHQRLEDLCEYTQPSSLIFGAGHCTRCSTPKFCIAASCINGTWPGTDLLVLRQLVPFYNRTTCRTVALITLQQVSSLMLHKKRREHPIAEEARTFVCLPYSDFGGKDMRKSQWYMYKTVIW